MILRLGVILAGFGLACLFAWLAPRIMQPPDRHSVAMALIEQGRAEEAAHLLEDPVWRGVAEYRAGRYRRALAAFFQDENTLTLYAMGNAYARLHEWRAATVAYEQVLQRDPRHADARHNLAIVKRAAEAERQLLAESREERALGQWRDGNRTDPGQQSDQPGTEAEGGESATGVTTQGGEPTDAAGREGQRGTAQDTATTTLAVSGLIEARADGEATTETDLVGAGLAAPEREAQQAAEILLRRIADDPARVLAARFNHVHAQRVETVE